MHTAKILVEQNRVKWMNTDFLSDTGFEYMKPKLQLGMNFVALDFNT